MIQGGGFTSSMKQKATNKPILNEADNGLSNLRGTLAMARTSDPHSATGQFFINHSDNTFLDHKAKSRQGWGYAVFGKVTKGLPVVDIIASAKTGSRAGMGDVPKENIVIISASVKH
jgi:peptidyl-prolyl cis-trans isomerase B (cyclophilin B)